MTKTFFILGLLLLLISCNSKPTTTQNEESSSVETASETQSLTEESDPEVPQEATLFDVTASLHKFSAKDEIKLYKAIEIIKTIIRTEEFRNRVLNFTYKGKKAFVDNKGLSNEQVYQKLLDGSETLKPEIDHEMNLELELYYSSRNTVGYTYPNVTRIWVNSKYFNPYTPSQVAGNLFHEWTHKLGFTHAAKNKAGRASSVPYALGYLIRELGKKLE